MKRILLMLIIAGAIGAGGYLTWAANSGERPFRSALRVACEDKLVENSHFAEETAGKCLQ